MLDSWAERRGVLARNWLERDPDLTPIRSHPRYGKLLERIDADSANRAASAQSADRTGAVT